ncbi:hypothetical protein HWV62_33129 [Athelia sp. TMB]|nr:hypothetical protein HWV62_33129 [Athelia sp. TMB]
MTKPRNGKAKSTARNNLPTSSNSAGPSFKPMPTYLAAEKALREDKAAKRAVDLQQKTKEMEILKAEAPLLKLDEYEEASEWATAALEQDPKNVKARYRRGVARKEMNYLKAAISDFENVLSIDPQCHEARGELAEARRMWEAGEGDEAGFDTDEDDEPRPDAPPYKDDDDSDSGSSDYFHWGNGIPCTFYNHGSCNKGTACAYSHAPDDKSIRDGFSDHLANGPLSSGSGKSSKPFILIISLGDSSMFNKIHAHLLTTLASMCECKQVTESKEALGTLWNRTPAAVLITDPTIADARNPHPTLTAKLVEYVRSGGTVVFGGLFSTFVAPDDSDAFFKNVWGLGWKVALYERADFVLNTHTHPQLLGGADLPELYNVKTIHLEGVAERDMVYTPADDLETYEVPVAYTQIGSGHVGYSGDVNGEDDTTNIVISLLGVRASDTKKGKASCAAFQKTAATRSSTTPSQPWSVSNVPFVLLVSLMDGSYFDDVYEHFTRGLMNKAEWLQATTSREALDTLAKRKVAAVFVTDPAIANAPKPHAKLAAALVTYAKNGGIVVFGGMFSSHVTTSKHDAFFKNIWGLNWKMGDYYRESFTANSSRHQVLKGRDVPGIPWNYNVKTVHLKGVVENDVVYAPVGDSKQIPVAYAKMGAGYVGYHGEVNGEKESTNILLTMLGMPARNVTFCLPKKSRAPARSMSGMGRGFGLSEYQERVMATLFGDDYGEDDDTDEEEERMMNGGYTSGEMNELLCQGIKPWDDDW